MTATRRSVTATRPEPGTAYVAAVLSGEIEAGALARKAIERHVQDLEDGGGRARQPKPWC